MFSQDPVLTLFSFHTGAVPAPFVSISPESVDNYVLYSSYNLWRRKGHSTNPALPPYQGNPQASSKITIGCAKKGSGTFYIRDHGFQTVQSVTCDMFVQAYGNFYQTLILKYFSK